MNCFFPIQSALSTNMKSPIRKLLFLTNQLSSGSLIYFAYLICFDSEKKKYAIRRQSYTKSIQNKKQHFTINFTQITFSCKQ